MGWRMEGNGCDNKAEERKRPKERDFVVSIKTAELNFSEATTQGSGNRRSLVSTPLLPRVSALCQASNWRRATAARCDMGHSWAATAWIAWVRRRLHVFAQAPARS